jgi:hypothetical protein
MQDVGWRDEPQNAQTGGYSLVLADRGKMIYYTGAGGVTLTIPANASVAFPIGTIIRIINNSGGNLSIAITTDTLNWLPSFTAGTRTLASRGFCNIEKVTATSWIITGTSLS